MLKSSNLIYWRSYSSKIPKIERPFRPTPQDIQHFQDNGFLIVPNLLPVEIVERTSSRLEGLFRGEFETGNYPDEWHWREGISLPNVTREICNAWKSDTSIASVVLSSYLGEVISQLGKWSGVRIAQDDVWMKPPHGGKEIGYHKDETYIPWNQITCWIALEDVSSETGTLEYIRGSHLWKEREQMDFNLSGFHAPSSNYRNEMYQAAQRANISHEEIEKNIVKVEVKKGGASFHMGGIWHGSSVNKSSRWRNNLAAHYIPSDSSFAGKGEVGYIYGRYKLVHSDHMDESFFPILWDNQGYRSSWLKNYCEDLIPHK